MVVIGQVYIATQFENWEAAEIVRRELQAHEYVVRARWIEVAAQGNAPAAPDNMDTHEGLLKARRNAILDLEDLTMATTVVFLSMGNGSAGRGGRHVEFGYALAQGKRCIVIGPRENVFHAYPGVLHYPSWKQFREDAGWA
jgi:hypothetical protein